MPECQVSVAPAGKLLAVIADTFKVVAGGQILDEDKMGATPPAAQEAQVVLLTFMASSNIIPHVFCDTKTLL